jgi:hypothetical protein
MSHVFYMVYLEGQNNPAYKHPTEQGATIEARRLSKLHNLKAYVLITLKTVEFTEFKESNLIKLDDELPF